MDFKSKNLDKNKIFIGLFLFILVFPWLGGGILRVVSPDMYKKISIVETEKREMAQIEWSNLLNTGESISTFVDDRFPFRYTLISWYKGLNENIEKPYERVETAIGNLVYKPAEKEVAQDEVADTKEVETTPEPVVEETPSVVDNYYPLNVYEDVIMGREQWLFLYGQNEIECYQGTNILTDEEMQSYADLVNQLQDICDSQGKELYIIIPPNKSQVYSQYMPTVDIATTYKREQRLYEYIAGHCRTPFVYPLAELLAGSNYYMTYYKYDTHWNQIGALYGTNALYVAMGVEQTDPSTWVTETVGVTKNDLVNLMGIPDANFYNDDTEVAVVYKPEVTVSGIDDIEADVIHTSSDGANDKSLCLVGDSFRVGMIPYLSKDFTRCTFAHRDNIKEIASDIKNADIIVIEAIERYDTDGFNSINRVINILNQ